MATVYYPAYEREFFRYYHDYFKTRLAEIEAEIAMCEQMIKTAYITHSTRQALKAHVATLKEAHAHHSRWIQHIEMMSGAL